MLTAMVVVKTPSRDDAKEKIYKIRVYFPEFGDLSGGVKKDLKDELIFQVQLDIDPKDQESIIKLESMIAAEAKRRDIWPISNFRFQSCVLGLSAII